jgi:vacuolar-type H+-ATPase subunit I/STV1
MSDDNGDLEVQLAEEKTANLKLRKENEKLIKVNDKLIKTNDALVKKNTEIKEIKAVLKDKEALLKDKDAAIDKLNDMLKTVRSDAEKEITVLKKETDKIQAEATEKITALTDELKTAQGIIAELEVVPVITKGPVEKSGKEIGGKVLSIDRELARSRKVKGIFKAYGCFSCGQYNGGKCLKHGIDVEPDDSCTHPKLIK